MEKIHITSTFFPSNNTCSIEETADLGINVAASLQMLPPAWTNAKARKCARYFMPFKRNPPASVQKGYATPVCDWPSRWSDHFPLHTDKNEPRECLEPVASPPHRRRFHKLSCAATSGSLNQCIALHFSLHRKPLAAALLHQTPNLYWYFHALATCPVAKA